MSRMLSEEEEVRIYHCLENARVYHGSTPQYIEISSEVIVLYLLWQYLHSMFKSPVG